MAEPNKSPFPEGSIPLTATNLDPVKQVIIETEKKENADDSNKSSDCGCGGYSNAEGSSSQSVSNNTPILVLGLVSVVAIFGMVLYLKKNNG